MSKPIIPTTQCACCGRQLKVLHVWTGGDTPQIPACLRCIRVADILGRWAVALSAWWVVEAAEAEWAEMLDRAAELAA